MFGEKVDATLRQRLKPNVLPIYATTILTSTASGCRMRRIRQHQVSYHQYFEALCEAFLFQTLKEGDVLGSLEPFRLEKLPCF